MELVPTYTLTYPELLGSIEEEDGNVDRFEDAAEGVNGDDEESSVLLEECIINPDHTA